MRATATRSGDWWAVEATFDGQPIYTQAKRLDQVADMVRDAFATLDIDVTDEVVDVLPTIPGDKAAQVARKASKQAAKAAAEASRAMRVAITELQAQNLPVRDVAVMLGISAQRVSQLTTGNTSAARRAQGRAAEAAAKQKSAATKETEATRKVAASNRRLARSASTGHLVTVAAAAKAPSTPSARRKA